MSVPFYVEEDRSLVIDYRDEAPGDSYNDVWPFFYNDLNNFIGIAIHHTAGPYTQSIDDICWFHVNVRKWGGVGYHFIIKDGKAYYVGDLGTGRAHVSSLNDKYIGICIVGNYTLTQPSNEDLRAAHLLCKEFIENEPSRFPNINQWQNVRPHKALTATACPGDIYPDYWDQILLGVDDDSDCEKELKKQTARAEEWKEKCREERKEHEVEIKQLNEKLERAIALANQFEESSSVCKQEKSDLEVHIVNLENEVDRWKNMYGICSDRLERFEEEKYNVAESILFLVDSIKEVVNKWLRESN